MSGGRIGKSGAPGFPALPSGVFSLAEMNEAKARSAWIVNPQTPYAKAILRMDGANNSTVFNDITGREWEALNGAKIITTESKFGGACGWFGDGDGTASIQLSDAPSLRPGTGPWTAFGWFKPVSAPSGGFGTCLTKGANTANGFTLAVTPTTMTFRAAGTTDTTVTSLSISTTAFSFLEWSYDGTTIRLFVNGALVGSAARSLTLTDASPLVLGQTLGTTTFNFRGRIDDFVFLVGIAGHTAAYTAPTVPYIL